MILACPAKAVIIAGPSNHRAVKLVTGPTVNLRPPGSVFPDLHSDNCVLKCLTQDGYGGSDDAAARTTHAIACYSSRGLVSCCEGSFHAIWARRPRVHRDVDREGQARRVGTLDPGPVAQRIEQQPSKLKVAGSIPAGVARKSNDLAIPPLSDSVDLATFLATFAGPAKQRRRLAPRPWPLARRHSGRGRSGASWC
jgi:hypothetical protein